MLGEINGQIRTKLLARFTTDQIRLGPCTLTPLFIAIAPILWLTPETQSQADPRSKLKSSQTHEELHREQPAVPVPNPEQ